MRMNQALLPYKVALPPNNNTELIRWVTPKELIFTMCKPCSFQYLSTEIGLGACIHVHRSPMNLYVSFTKTIKPIPHEEEVRERERGERGC
jgi:hypothetical protein